MMIPDREYVFSSSYIKACSSKGTPAERLARFRDAADAGALRAIAAEVFNAAADNPYDDAITAAVSVCREALPDFSVIKPLLYKYDCTNIKTAIKCKIRNIPAEKLMFSCGTIPVTAVIAAGESSDFSAIPGEMGKAASKAVNEYGKTGEVRNIDLLLDCAAFTDMKREAEESGCELIRDIVAVRADGVNFITAMRLNSAGMASDTAASLFERAFVPGGTMGTEAFCSKNSGVFPVKKISSYAKGVSSAPVKTAAAEGVNGDEAQRIFDEAVLKMCSKYRYKPFGPEVAIAFIVVREAEITNCRIIEAAQKTADKDEILRERLRVAYV